MALALDSQDNVYVTGRAMIGGQGTEILTMKLAGNDGQIMWTQLVGGAALQDDIAWDIVVGPDGNPVIAGYIVDTGNVAHYFTRKLDAVDGDPIWERIEPGALNNIEVRSGWLGVMDDGDLVLCHRTFGSNGYDVVLRRYDASDGATVWATLYDGPTHGGDDVRAMRLDSQGNLLVAGVQDAFWNYNYMVLKFSSADGSLLWSSSYDGPPGWYDVANCVAEGPGGSVVVSGLSDGSGTGWDWATVAYDGVDGTRLWEMRHNGPASQSDEARDVFCTPQGDVYVTGYAYGPATGKDFLTIRYVAPAASPAGDLPAPALALRAWPNPFNPRVALSFAMPRDGRAELVIYDLAGRRVATLLDGPVTAGAHTVHWDGRGQDGRSVAGGTYLAVARGAGTRSVGKLVLAK